MYSLELLTERPSETRRVDTANCLLVGILAQQYLFDICLLLYVQSWTPDDGQKDRHLETCRVLLHIKYIWDIGASSWFYYRNVLRCMALWTSHSCRIKCSCLGFRVSFLIKFTCLGKEYIILGMERADIHCGTSCHFPLCRLWVMFLWMWRWWSECKPTCWKSLELLGLWWPSGTTRHLCTLGHCI